MALAVGALALTLAGCGGDSLESKDDEGSSGGDSGGSKKSLTIGSAGFTESKIMANLYAKVLSDAGFDTDIKTLSNRELYAPALEKGQIDVVPEYAATLAEFLNAKVNGADAATEKPIASSDVDKTVAALTKLAEPRGLKVLDSGEAVDQNAFAVTEKFAKENKLKSLTDLGKAGVEVKVAAGEECAERPFCRPGLEKKYGIDVTGIDPKGVGTVQSKQAVKDGTDQMVLTTTTDGTLKDFGLVVLEDDKKLQNADNVLPVVNAKDAGGADVAEALNKVTGALTTQDLVEMNRSVDSQREKPEDVAEEFLESKKLIG
ncbi:ABC transporter substrate-binding protein [Streptomyces sp. NPDC054784]